MDFFGGGVMYILHALEAMQALGCQASHLPFSSKSSALPRLLFLFGRFLRCVCVWFVER